MYDLQVQYSITKAGTYSLHILFSGIVGAQSPVDLMVLSAATDVSRTYGYGAVKHSSAGATSSIYVQTRDSYGNNVRVDPETSPSGTEEISFELCRSIENDPSRACFGGAPESSVSISLSYGSGPPGSNGIAYGLYKLSYFPFTDGVFIPIVRHNNSVVVCLFDTSELPEAKVPGMSEVDSCIVHAEESVLATRRISSSYSVQPQQSKRLAIGNIEMVVNTTFKEPDLQSARSLTFLAPIIAALIGVVVDLLCGIVIPALQSRFRKSQLSVVANADSSISERFSISFLHLFLLN